MHIVPYFSHSPYNPHLPFLLCTLYMFSDAVLQAITLNVSDHNDDRVIIIDTLELLEPDDLYIVVDVPGELLKMSYNLDGQVRVTSSVFMNVEGLFPDGLSTRNE